MSSPLTSTERAEFLPAGGEPLPISTLLEAGPILLYDGDCGVCSRSVQWILRHERRSTLRFAALKSPLGVELIRRAAVAADVDSLLWVEAEGERIVARKWSEAILQAVKYVGGPWKLLLVARILPKSVRDAAYRLFARHRSSVAAPVCLIPPPETRARFFEAKSR